MSENETPIVREGVDEPDVAMPHPMSPLAESGGPAGAQVSNAPEAAPAAIPAADMTPIQRNYRKTRRGYVVSNKMQKTIVVEVEDRVKHPLYGKVIRRSSKYKAHDEHDTAGVGDLVLIMETRPLSATKRWRLVEILEKAK
jgi:small subunit ribosomal protein S17